MGLPILTNNPASMLTISNSVSTASMSLSVVRASHSTLWPLACKHCCRKRPAWNVLDRLLVSFFIGFLFFFRFFGRGSHHLPTLLSPLRGFAECGNVPMAHSGSCRAVTPFELLGKAYQAHRQSRSNTNFKRNTTTHTSIIVAKQAPSTRTMKISIIIIHFFNR